MAGLGGVTLKVVAGVVSKTVITTGSNNPKLLLVTIVRGPKVVAVYVKLEDGCPVFNVRVEGVKIPPAPPSVGVMITSFEVVLDSSATV